MAVDTSTMSTPHSQISPRIWRPLVVGVAVWSSIFVIDWSAFMLISYRCYCCCCFCCALLRRLLVKPVARFELSAARRVVDKPQITYRLMLLLLYICLFTLVGSKKIPVSRYAAAEMRELLADQAMELYLKSSRIPYNTQDEWGTFFVLLFSIKISYGLSKFSTLLLIKFDISRGISIVCAVLMVS